MRIWICVLAACILQPCGAATVRTFNGQTHSGKLGFGPGAITITPNGGEPVKINPAELVVLTAQNPSGAPDTFPPGVLLIDGTLVGGPVKSLESLAAKFGSAGVTIPAQSVSALVFARVSRAHLLERAATKLGAILPNEDFYEGELISIKGDKATMNSMVFGPKRFAIKDKIQAVVMRPVQNFPAVFEVSAKDGSRYLTSDLRFEADLIALKEPVLGEIKIKSADLVEIRAGPGRFLAATGLKPAQIEAPAGVDKTTAVVIEAGGDSARPSITTAVNAAVTYAVPPALTLFTCEAEVTKDTPIHAKVSFAVYGDGRLLFRSPTKGPGEAPEVIKVPLGMTKAVTLRVEPASAGSSIGAGVWTSPAFLRQ